MASCQCQPRGEEHWVVSGHQRAVISVTNALMSVRVKTNSGHQVSDTKRCEITGDYAEMQLKLENWLGIRKKMVRGLHCTVLCLSE